MAQVLLIFFYIDGYQAQVALYGTIEHAFISNYRATHPADDDDAAFGSVAQETPPRVRPCPAYIRDVLVCRWEGRIEMIAKKRKETGGGVSGMGGGEDAMNGQKEKRRKETHLACPTRWGGCPGYFIDSRWTAPHPSHPLPSPSSTPLLLLAVSPGRS